MLSLSSWYSARSAIECVGVGVGVDDGLVVFVSGPCVDLGVGGIVDETIGLDVLYNFLDSGRYRLD